MVNRMILQGRLTRDPELKKTSNGISVCTFTVAWSEKIGENELKLFLPVTAWRESAEVVSNYFSKGSEIAVEGRLQQREWTDSDGNKKHVIEMQAEKVHFCGPKTQGKQKNHHSEEPEEQSGDLPF